MDSPADRFDADRLLQFCAWGVFVFLAAFAVFYVPMNMDEAGIFHTLACRDYPFAALHTFREACAAQNDLATPLGFTLFRPEFYTGVFHSVLYTPFYFLIHAPEGQYVFGLVFLGAFAFLFARLLPKPRLALPLILSFFPFVLQFVHDAGPVKTTLLLFPAAVFLFRRMTAPSGAAPSGAARYGAAPFGAALLLALAALCVTEEKPFFLYLVPSLSLFVFAFTGEKGGDRLARMRAAWPVLAVSASAFLFGAALLFLARNQQGQTYIGWLIDLAGHKVSFGAWLGHTAAFLLYWPSYAHNYFDVALDSPGAFFLSFATLLGGGAFLVAVPGAAAGQDRGRARLLLAAVAAGLLVFGIVRNTWAGHHFVFLWVPLLALFLTRLLTARPGARLFFGGLFLALNLVAALVLTQKPVLLRASRDKEAIFAYFNDPARAASSLVNFASWGGYYIQSLYGPKTQLVVYTEPYEPEEARRAVLYPRWAQELLALAATTHRTLYTVCYDPLCDAAALRAVFGATAKIDKVLPGLREWRVFAVAPGTAALGGSDLR